MRIRPIVVSFVLLGVAVSGPLRADSRDALVFSTVQDHPEAELAESIVREVYDLIGIPIRVVKYRPARSLVMSNSGTVDGELGRKAGILKDYPHLRMVEEPLFVLEPAVFTKGSEFSVTGWESLQSYRVGIVRGMQYAELGTKGMDLMYATESEQLFKMLARDRIDVAVTEKTIGLKLRQLKPFQSIKMLDPPLERIPIHHYLHEKHLSLLPTVSAAVETLRVSGRLNDLIQEFRAKEEGNDSQVLPEQ